MFKTENHPLIVFAATYGDPLSDYLNAAVALNRLEILLDDLNKVAGLLEAEHPEGQRWSPWVGAEAISFYAVGFVTCLEWHAKSRLVDLLNYKPSAIRLTDVQKTITDKLIVQMVAKQASATQLVGASLKIGSLAAYLTVLDRVFGELDFPFSVRDWITGHAPEAFACWIKPDDFANLERLFQFRHSLVHELGIRTMGHPNVRDAWVPDEARSHGRLVASLMTGIEAALTHHAPQVFPNLLTDAGQPVGQVETLRREFQRLDAAVDSAMSNLGPSEDRTRSAWSSVRSAFAVFAEAEEQFVRVAAMLHWRYFDARTPLRVRTLRYRIEYLKDLMSHFAADGDAANPPGSAATAQDTNAD